MCTDLILAGNELPVDVLSRLFRVRVSYLLVDVGETPHGNQNHLHFSVFLPLSGA